MSTHDKTAQQRILEAVLDCIEQDGIQALTTREIAQAAGVNIASINYYFRSKDAAVAEALAMALKSMQEDVGAILADETIPFLSALEQVLDYLVQGAFLFPRTTMAHLYPALMEGQYNTPVAQDMRAIVDGLAARWQHEHPGSDPAEARVALAQIISMTVFVMLAPGFFAASQPVDLTSPDGQRAYLRRLVQAYFPAPAGP